MVPSRQLLVHVGSVYRSTGKVQAPPRQSRALLRMCSKQPPRVRQCRRKPQPCPEFWEFRVNGKPAVS